MTQGAPETETETAETDIVVVGGGGAGLMAALEARKLGKRVILLEKSDRVGGTTALAVGSIMATQTALQRRAGISDTPAEHAADLCAVSSRMKVADDAALRAVLTGHAPEAIAILERIGVDFIGPMPQPPHAKPRMHQVVPGAAAFIHHLERHCRRAGVDIRTGVRVERLLSADGRVTGVLARTNAGAMLRVQARNGAILASGDVSANADMVARYVEPGLDHIPAFNPLSTGDGQAMAIELGGQIVPRHELGADNLVQMRFAPPAKATIFQRLPQNRAVSKLARLAMRVLPGAILRPLMMRFLTTALGPDRGVFEAGAILVNAEGHRFADELAAVSVRDIGHYERNAAASGDRQAPGLLLAGQPGGTGYIIFDGPLARRFSAWPHFISTAPGIAYAYLDDYRKTRKDLFHEGGTIDELARAIGADPAKLRHSIETANTPRPEGEGRLETPPFVALGPLRAWIFVVPLGLSVDPELRVLKSDSTAIPGLYAAGSTGLGGVSITGHGHGLAWAFGSGLVAARSAARATPG